MRLETCIRKGLRLKAHRVGEVREEEGVLVAEIERIEGRRLTCGVCSRRTRRIHSRRPRREWRDLRVRDQTLVLAYSTGQPLKVLSHEIAEATARGWEDYKDAAFSHFDQLKALLDARDPSYRD